MKRGPQDCPADLFRFTGYAGLPSLVAVLSILQHMIKISEG